MKVREIKKFFIDFKLASKVENRKQLKVLQELAPFSSVYVNDKGGSYIIVGENMWYLRLNKNNKITSACLWGSKVNFFKDFENVPTSI